MSDGTDRDRVQAVLRRVGWNLTVTNSLTVGLVHQQKDPHPIILYDRELPQENWREAVSSFTRLTPRPCLVLLSRNTDKNLWDELIRCGGFDLLRTPVEPDALVRTVRAGWSIWFNHRSPSEPTVERCS
jgi:DNA-binding NtrC family response regulator